jgi:hypothetical protein
MIRCITWAKAHQRKRWNKTIFSNETMFQMFCNTIQVHYKSGELRPRHATVEHPFKVHLWGHFVQKEQWPVGFHIFTENMNGELYREILTQNLFEQAHQILGCGWIFQQDNDPKHCARLTVELLENRCPQVLDWPSYSPDLNPIEDLWSIIKRNVEKKVNIMISEKKSITQEVFISTIVEEWEAIDRSLCLNLANSMPKRIELVIANEGRTIDY